MNRQELLARIVALEEMAEEPEFHEIQVVFVSQRPGAGPGDWRDPVERDGPLFRFKVPPKDWKKRLRRRRND